MNYYPDREAYLQSVGDACGQAEANVLDSLTDGIERTLNELKLVLDKDVYQVVRSKFEADFPIRKGEC